MKTATVTFHIWKSLVDKADYKMSDIPNTWDVFIDFFLPVLLFRNQPCDSASVACDNEGFAALDLAQNAGQVRFGIG